MNVAELEAKARKLRREAVRMVYEAKDGHPGPALSIADIITVLYFEDMRIDSSDPNMEGRDRLVLSKGHACPILYAALNEAGYFSPKIEHFDLRQLGSIFQGHPSMRSTPGIDMTSGSLGNGIAVAAGMAMAGKLQKKDYTVFCICGDGELQEGACWEGVNIAAGNALDNLIVFVDKNGWQSYKQITDTIGINNPGERFRAFGWDVQKIDGHDLMAIHEAIATAKATPGKPHCIVCRCIKGKGVSYMENNNAWHKGVPTEEQYRLAMKELGGEQQ